MTKTKFTTRQIALCGLIAAVYAALTVSTSWIAYGPFQFRTQRPSACCPPFCPSPRWGCLWAA